MLSGSLTCVLSVVHVASWATPRGPVHKRFCELGPMCKQWPLGHACCRQWPSWACLSCADLLGLCARARSLLGLRLTSELVRGSGPYMLCACLWLWHRTSDVRLHLFCREVLDLFCAHTVVEVVSVFEGHCVIVSISFSFYERRNAALRRAIRKRSTVSRKRASNRLQNLARPLLQRSDRTTTLATRSQSNDGVCAARAQTYRWAHPSALPVEIARKPTRVCRNDRR